jgi:methionyl-tRNA synthetase
MNDRNSPLLLSTAIPYVKAAPHVGHAFELLIADALGRHQRQRGRQVRLTGGTDDHSLKNARAAAARGIPTRELVGEQGAIFQHLQPALDVQLDDYLHTSRDARHAPAVQALWRRCAERGDLYTRAYVGLYCAGCEAFLRTEDCVDGRCPSHREPLETVSERNWFFRLSHYRERLLDALGGGALRILPRERHSEVVSFVRAGLEDFSVSRASGRSRDWGIAVPDDPSQVIYVWFDALANYLSLLGFPEHTPELATYWGPQAGERAHLIGKDILRFHAIYWPAILASAGLPLPTSILTHGFLTSEGKKISKSLGNAIDPFQLVHDYGVDAVRFYFLRHLHSTKDSDFKVERLLEAHDTELAGKLGNLLQRASALALRHPGLELRRHGSVASDADLRLSDAAGRASTEVTAAFDGFALHQGLAAVFELIAAANRYADEQEPWTLSRRAITTASALAAADLRSQLGHVLWHLLEALRVAAVLLWPFLPAAARRIGARLGVSAAQLEEARAARFGAQQRFCLVAGPPLFPRLASGGARSRVA